MSIYSTLGTVLITTLGGGLMTGCNSGQDGEPDDAKTYLHTLNKPTIDTKSESYKKKQDFFYDNVLRKVELEAAKNQMKSDEGYRLFIDVTVKKLDDLQYKAKYEPVTKEMQQEFDKQTFMLHFMKKHFNDFLSGKVKTPKYAMRASDLEEETKFMKKDIQEEIDNMKRLFNREDEYTKFVEAKSLERRNATSKAYALKTKLSEMWRVEKDEAEYVIRITEKREKIRQEMMKEYNEWATAEKAKIEKQKADDLAEKARIAEETAAQRRKEEQRKATPKRTTQRKQTPTRTRTNTTKRTPTRKPAPAPRPKPAPKPRPAPKPKPTPKPTTKRNTSTPKGDKGIVLEKRDGTEAGRQRKKAANERLKQKQREEKKRKADAAQRKKVEEARQRELAKMKNGG